MPSLRHAVRSRDGGHKPAWARGGKEIVYKYGGAMYVAAVKAGVKFESATALTVVTNFFDVLQGLLPSRRK
jgi:hypothetical protein